MPPWIEEATVLIPAICGIAIADVPPCAIPREAELLVEPMEATGACARTPPPFPEELSRTELIVYTYPLPEPLYGEAKLTADAVRVHSKIAMTVKNFFKLIPF